MIVCSTCGREMTCVRNGVSVDFGAGHCYAGDVFQCGSCGAEVCSTNKQSHYDADYKLHREYIRTQQALDLISKFSELKGETYNRDFALGYLNEEGNWQS